jgi:hypothetical protein
VRRAAGDGLPSDLASTTSRRFAIKSMGFLEGRRRDLGFPARSWLGASLQLVAGLLVVLLSGAKGDRLFAKAERQSQAQKNK